MSKLKQFWKTICAIARGIKKFSGWAVTAADALAWGIALFVMGYILYRTFRGDMALGDFQLYAIFGAFSVLTGRVLIEGAKYFERIGSVEEK
jgi:hypothetical protein